ncbi:MAG: diacylglycerol kinase catalytic domain-containing protein [Pirellulales bacterium]
MGFLPPTIAVVSQPTRLQGLVARYATRGAAMFRLQQAFLHERARQPSPTVRSGKQRAESTAAVAGDLEASKGVLTEYEQEDSAQQKTLDRLKKELDLGYPVKFVQREFLPTFDFRGCVAVVVVGRDGLVANTAKYVGDLPIVAVNPDPQRIDGILLPFQVRQARQAVERAMANRAKIREVTLAEVNLNDGQRMLAFNDFFVGCRSHVSAQYVLRVEKRSEPQSSSGLIVSTGAGSTGWLSSLFNMAEGFARWTGGQVADHARMAWEDRRLVWAVREPFRSKQSGADLVAGFLEQGHELVVESLMPSGGVVFSDGVEADFLEFTSGTIARIGIASQRARLVVG